MKGLAAPWYGDHPIRRAPPSPSLHAISVLMLGAQTIPSLTLQFLDQDWGPGTKIVGAFLAVSEMYVDDKLEARPALILACSVTLSCVALLLWPTPVPDPSPSPPSGWASGRHGHCHRRRRLRLRSHDGGDAGAAHACRPRRSGWPLPGATGNIRHRGVAAGRPGGWRCSGVGPGTPFITAAARGGGAST